MSTEYKQVHWVYLALISLFVISTIDAFSRDPVSASELRIFKSPANAIAGTVLIWIMALSSPGFGRILTRQFLQMKRFFPNLILQPASWSEYPFQNGNLFGILNLFTMLAWGGVGHVVYLAIRANWFFIFAIPAMILLGLGIQSGARAPFRVTKT